MFVGAEAIVDAGFDAACGRLTRLARDGWLLGVSHAAYAAGGPGLARVGPYGAMPGLSRLVDVHYRDLVIRGDVAVMVLRWEAAGTGGGLFPVLDADIALSRNGRSQTQLAVTGAYRPPLGPLGAALDRVLLRRVATATIQHFVMLLTEPLADPPGAAAPAAGTGPGLRQQAGQGHATTSPRDAAADPDP